MVLPLPFSPSRERISPRLISREISSLATTLPNRFVTVSYTHLDVYKRQLLGQCIGRWANFINREAFGAETTLPWRMRLWTSATEYIEPPHFPV